MKRVPLLIHVAAAAFALLAAGPAASAWLWRSDAGGLTRIETESGEVRALAGFPRADSIEPDREGGAWVRVGAQLIRVDADLNLALRANLGTAPGASAPMVWDAAARRLWVAHGGDLLTYDENLSLLAKRPQGDRISGLAIAGPRAVWIVAGSSLRQLDAAGALLDAVDLGALGIGGAVQGLLVDPLRAKLWLVTDAELISLSADRGLKLLHRLPISASARAAAIDMNTGDVLLQSGAAWRRLGESTVKSAARDVVARGETTGVIHFAARTQPSVELAVAGPVEFFRGTVASDRPWLVAPRASIEVVAANSQIDGDSVQGIRFLVQPGAICDGSQCSGAETLLDGVRADAIFDHAPLAGHSIAGPAGEREIAIELGMLPVGSIHSLAVALEDAYGNRSDEERWSVTVGADGRPVLAKAGPKALPVISITSPANNASFVAPASITINTSASESGGTITKVEFYRNGTLLGTDTTSPYSFAWTGVAIGTYALTAKAYDSLGGSTTSATVNVQVKANVAPTVSLTAPANNATFVAPATINLAASASDSDGTVSKVEFYNGAALLGTDTTSPYTYAWANVAVGTYSLTAKAYDNLGATTASTAVSVQVKANVAPTVTLTLPANNAAYTAPATVSLAATASDTDGTVTKVAFYNGATLLATITTAPYTYTWSNVAGGAYSLTAKATDDKGAVTTSAAKAITVNKPPTATLTAPANGATYAAPATINLAASATDADGTIAKVEFYQGATLLGTDTTSPYNYAWNNVGVGSYTLTAKSTDNKGAATTSAPINVTVNPNKSPAITITSPADGTAYVSPATINVVASASDPDGTISKVQFYGTGPTTLLTGTDTTAPYSFKWVGVGEGLLQITAKATDNLGAITTSPPITVNVLPNQPPIITLTGTPAPGEILFLAPPTIHLAATAFDVDGTIAEVRFYAPDPVTAEMVLAKTATQAPYEFDWNDPGLASVPSTLLQFCAEAVDNGGAVTQSAYLYYDLSIDREPVPRVAEPHSSPNIFTAPATIVLVATADDPDLGTGVEAIAKVEFLEGATVLASFSAPNGGQGEFVWVWRNPTVGDHSITVRATDLLGVTADAVADVRVLPVFVPATVALTQPMSGSQYGSTVPLQATVTGGSAPIARVDFVNAIGSVAASASTSPYTATWTGAPVGPHSITAQAVDSYGNVAISPTAFVSVLGPIVGLPGAVVLTAPVASNTYPAGLPITVAAEVLDPAKAVTSVKFYASGSLIGSVSTAPYSVVFSNPWSGTYPLSVVVGDGLGHNVSDAVTVTFANNNASPTVSLTTPANGATFAAPATIGLAATASDPDGTIAKVEFYAGASKVATATTSPYTATWSNVSAGTYALTAKATDNKGSVTTSAPATISVLSAANIAIVTPASGARFSGGQSISVIAQASIPGHTVNRIEFYADAVLLGTVTMSGTFTSATATYNWVGASVGSHALNAKVVANDGYSLTSSAVGILISDLAVTLIEPRAWQTYVTPVEVRIIAIPSETGVAISQIDFYGDGILLGSRTTGPYVWVWNAVAAGTHTLFARARDANGLTSDSTSVPVTVTGVPTVNVDSGIDGSTIGDDNVSISGSVQAPANSAVAINGQLASLGLDGRFFINGLSLVDGANTLTVVLNAPDGASATQTINVTRNGQQPFEVHVDPHEGLAPLNVRMQITNRGNVPFKRITIDTNGDGTNELELTGLADGEATLSITYQDPGVRTIVVKVYDMQDILFYTSKNKILVRDPRDIADGSFGIYAGMLERLRVGNVSGALNAFTGSMRDKYQAIFTSLQPNLATIVDQLGALQYITVTGEIAELAVVRNGTNGPQTFQIYLIRSEDGIWRIDGM